MSYNKAQFSVAFNPADLIDNLKSAKKAALGRDRTIAQLNKMSDLNNPWKKFTAYSTLSNFSPAYQQQLIEALNGPNFEKQYMRDISSYIEQKTAHAKKEQDVLNKLREADIVRGINEAAGSENIAQEFIGGGGAAYVVNPEDPQISSDIGGRLAGMQASLEIGPQEQQEPQVRVRKGRKFKPLEDWAAGFQPKSKAEELQLLQEERDAEEAFARFMGRDPMAGLAEIDPSFIEASRRVGIRKGKKLSRSAELSGATTAGLASPSSFELASGGEFGSFSLMGGSEAKPPKLGQTFDVGGAVAEFLAANPIPTKARQDEIEAYEEYLYRRLTNFTTAEPFKAWKKIYYAHSN